MASCVSGCSPVVRFCQKLNRLKTLEEDVMATSLKRCLSTVDLALLGVGGMVGSGLYVLTGTVAKDTAGPAVVVSFIIAGIAVSHGSTVLCWVWCPCTKDRLRLHVYIRLCWGNLGIPDWLECNFRVYDWWGCSSSCMEWVFGLYFQSPNPEFHSESCDALGCALPCSLPRPLSGSHPPNSFLFRFIWCSCLILAKPHLLGRQYGSHCFYLGVWLCTGRPSQLERSGGRLCPLWTFRHPGRNCNMLLCLRWLWCDSGFQRGGQQSSEGCSCSDCNLTGPGSHSICPGVYGSYADGSMAYARPKLSTLRRVLQTRI